MEEGCYRYIMNQCFSCGGPLRTVREGLYRCLYCGQLNEEREGQILPRKMEVFPRIEKVREAAAEGVYEMASSVPSKQGLSSDMVTFINRIIEGIAPLKGLDREATTRALKVRGEFNRELTRILEGEGDFDEWYTRTASDLGINDRIMTKILFDALEGLKSPEAKNLREVYGKIMQRSMFG